MLLITLVAFLAVMTVLILAHELGHFTTAKAFKIKVEEFGLGYPPRLFGLKRGETVYSLNAIPVGGFTKMVGEEDPSIPRSLAGKSIGVRFLVLAAGALMNALLPVVLFSLALMVPHDALVGEVIVKGVAPDSPAAMSGIKEGDILLEINGKPIGSAGDLQHYVQLNLGRAVTLSTRRDSVALEMRLTPRWKPPEGQGPLGVALDTLNPMVIRVSYPFWEAIPLGTVECIESYIVVKNAFISMFIGTAPVQIGGPVAIAQLTGEMVRAGLSTLLEFAAFLSINLAIINLLPLPALDGGRIAFVLLEWLRRGKRISPKTEGLVHLIGFTTLLVFILLITLQDIIRIIQGGSLLP